MYRDIRSVFLKVETDRCTDEWCNSEKKQSPGNTHRVPSYFREREKKTNRKHNIRAQKRLQEIMQNRTGKERKGKVIVRLVFSDNNHNRILHAPDSVSGGSFAIHSLFGTKTDHWHTVYAHDRLLLLDNNILSFQ